MREVLENGEVTAVVAMVCVDSCSDGPIAICRICQAVTACLFLFIGITCQFYAGLNTNDISLGNLCDTYSGSSEIMDQRAFDNLFDWYALLPSNSYFLQKVTSHNHLWHLTCIPCLHQ